MQEEGCQVKKCREGTEVAPQEIKEAAWKSGAVKTMNGKNNTWEKGVSKKKGKAGVFREGLWKMEQCGEF